jgi:hypothetical protein
VKHIQQTPWTDEERAMLRRLRQNGLGATRIGVMMGRSKSSVEKQLRYLALNQTAPRPQAPKRPSHDAGGGIRAGRTTLPPLPSLQD